jgi:hypothetical protein
MIYTLLLLLLLLYIYIHILLWKLSIVNQYDIVYMINDVIRRYKQTVISLGNTKIVCLKMGSTISDNCLV